MFGERAASIPVIYRISCAGFPNNLPRCQAARGELVSLIIWHSIGTNILKVRLASQRRSFQRCAKLCLHKIAPLPARLPRDARHFMQEKPIISSLLSSV